MANRKIGTQYVLTTVTSILAVALNYIITLRLTPYITENIGTEAYGFVSMAKTFANYASIFTVALNSFASRYISMEYHQGNIKQANVYFNSVFIANLVLGAVIMGVSAVAIWKLEVFLEIPAALMTDVKMLFLLDMINFLVLASSTVFMSATIIRNRLELGNVVKCVAYLAEAVFLYCAFTFFPTKRVFYVGIGLILSSVVILVMNMVLNRRFTPELKLNKRDYSGKAVKQIAGNGIWNSVNALGNTLNTGLDLMISNVMLSATRAGQLAIVKTISTVCTTLFQLVSHPLQPIQLKYFAANDKKQLVNSFKLGVKINGMLSNILFAGFAIFGSVYYKLWTPGEDYVLLQSVSIVVILGSIIEGAVHPLYYAYTLTLKNKIPCYVTIASGVCNVAGMFFLLEYTNADIYAVVGTTAVLTWLVNFVFNPIYAAKSLNVSKWTFYPILLRHILSCVLMTAAFYGISRIWFPDTWLELLAVALICAVVGAVIHLAMVLSREEMKKILHNLHHKAPAAPEQEEIVEEKAVTMEEILFALLRSEVCGGTISDKMKAALTPEILQEMYELAKKNDLSHIVGQALGKQGLLGKDELSAQLRKDTKLAAYRYLQQDMAYQQMCSVLEEAKIPFIPLKGSVLRTYYPEPWQRTSCDIDILVPESRLYEAADVLVEKLKFSAPQKTDHDLSMFAPGGVHLELHYATIDEGRLPEAQAVLAHVWDDASVQEEGSVRHWQSDEMFYFYHIAHMAKHFENGGCGIRPFLDMWILNHRIPYDAQKRDKLLAEGGMLTFAKKMETLCEIWFSGAQTDALSQQVGDYVIHGGMYRNKKNQFAIQRARGKSKFGYFLQKTFLPHKELKKYYPVLEKHKWLTPACEFARWMKIIFKGGIKRSVHELKTYNEITQEEIETTEDLLKALEL